MRELPWIVPELFPLLSFYFLFHNFLHLSVNVFSHRDVFIGGHSVSVDE